MPAAAAAAAAAGLTLVFVDDVVRGGPGLGWLEGVEYDVFAALMASTEACRGGRP